MALFDKKFDWYDLFVPGSQLISAKDGLQKIAGGISKGIGNLVNNATGTTAQNEFNAQQAIEQREFTEHMYDRELEAANTALQRQKADAIAAGINPDYLFANGASGASSPTAQGGSSASSGTGTGAGLIGALSNMVSSAASYTNNKNISTKQTAQISKNVNNLVHVARVLASKGVFK